MEPPGVWADVPVRVPVEAAVAVGRTLVWVRDGAASEADVVPVAVRVELLGLCADVAARPGARVLLEAVVFLALLLVLVAAAAAVVERAVPDAARVAAVEEDTARPLPVLVDSRRASRRARAISA